MCGLCGLQSDISETTAGDLSADMSVVSGARSLLTDDVRVGLQRVIQVFITHSANVFLVESPPPPPPTVHTTGREVTTVTGDQPLRLEDQVSQCAGLILYTCYRVSLHFTVKPIVFTCPLFREFRDPDEFAKITGREYIF